MGCNTSPAWIQFPVRFLDEELRKCLEEHEDVEFTEDGQPVAHDDPEVSVTDGLFYLHNSEVCYGMFEELETLLVGRGIPFDRHTSADWDIIPCDRVYRPGWQPGQPVLWASGANFPGNPDLDDFNREFVLNPENDEPAVSLRDIRELLAPGLRDKDDEGNERDPWEAVEAILSLARYLDDKFPAYPELSEYVEAAPHES
jgi:hypothetical protein